jgi:hypothetical protein
VLEVVGYRVRDGIVRAALTLSRSGVVLSHDAVTLTSARNRANFIRRLADRGVAVPEGALLALDAACREANNDRARDDGEERATGEARGPVRRLADLLEAVAALLRRYVVFADEAQLIAITLWIAHTHAFDAADATPYLHIRSAEKRSGKSRVLELLEQLVHRPWRVVAATAPVVFRKIKRDQPTILLDEVGTIFKVKATETAEALRGVLNAGYRRGACVPRCTGKDFEKLEDFPVYSPKALAGLGRLPDTVADRSIAIVLRRKMKDEPVARFRFSSVAGEAKLLQRALAVWGTSAVASLRHAHPAVPASLDDRASEVWEPLLAIADLAGDRWPAAAQRAATTLHAKGDDAESVGVLLLAAIREVFDTVGFDRVLTSELLGHLVEREQEPWPGWWGAEVDKAFKDSLTPRRAAMELARRLRAFDVQPTTLRTASGERGKGYHLADFADVFARYLCNIGALTPRKGCAAVTTHAAQGFQASRDEEGRQGVVTPQTLAAQGSSRVTTEKGDISGDFLLGSPYAAGDEADRGGPGTPAGLPCTDCGAAAEVRYAGSHGEAWCQACWEQRTE